MPFKYSCFISYCHGQGELMKGFVQELKQALRDYLEPYLDEEIYIDEDRLQPGFKFNTALAKAICQSVCMIVVYVPKYPKHTYCLQEYTAMEKIEEMRLELLGSNHDSERGMIIPILFRGDRDKLPQKIRSHRHFCDFSKFTTAFTSIRRKKEYVEKIEDIAQFVARLYDECRSSGKELCSSCDAFEMPTEDEIGGWRPQRFGRKSQLPLYEEGK